jgi:hypothetical protein
MKDKLKLVLVLTVVVFLIPLAVTLAQVEEGTTDSLIEEQRVVPPPGPIIISGEDLPNDNGHKLKLNWEYPMEWADSIARFEIYRADSPAGEFKLLGEAPGGVTTYLDIGSKEKYSSDYMANDHDFYYRGDAVTGEGVSTESEIGGPFQTSGQWFHKGKIPVLVGVVLFGMFTLYFIRIARKGKALYVRPLAGIEAVDEAIGRATEMGKPILYVLGIGTAADIATIASFTILGRVAKKVAEYQTSLIVPCYEPIVMSVAQDVVRSAYLEAGRPDQYSDDQVFFVTNAQFAYVAGVNGIMVRDLPATNFYLGYFAAESLILAETGNSIGAIQIAGTDQITQIPFFVVACDYTLIGEELYAASAYLGRDPLLLGSLKAEDWAKAIVMILLVIGVLATAFGWDVIRELVKVNL